MASEVTALLVLHNEPVLAQRALAAIKAQTIQPTRIVVVDSSKESIELPIETIQVAADLKLGQLIATGLSNLPESANHWIWLVHDDSEPKPNALAELLLSVETSETIAQVGPMQLSASNQRQINQLGLTLSNYGELINPVKGQLDQTQHDSVVDVLAVGTNGMLVRSDVYKQVGGLNDSLPTLAADFDLSLRIHRHGFRVVTAPRAKVLHANLLMAGQRKTRWLGGSAKTAMRRASIALHLVHDSLWLAIGYWLFLPLLTTYRIFWRLAQKRPGFLWSEIRAGLWGFFTMPKLFGARSNVGAQPISSVKRLRASRETVLAHKRADLEAEESAQSLAAFERGEHETQSVEKSKTFTEALGWIFVIALLAVSWRQLPFGEALSGGSALPLAHDWFSLFARAGASWQPIGRGFFGPADPFNWVLLTFGSITFWSPSLSLVVLLWIARSLAFITAWKALSLISAKTWQRNLGALAFALLPALNESIGGGEIASVVATISLPWLVYAIARAAGLGRSGSARSDSRTWSWVGLSGVLLAIVGASSPLLALLALLGLALVAFTKIRRFGYLFWIPLPLAVIYVPLAFYEIVALQHPMALLAEPTVGFTNRNSAIAAIGNITNWTNWSLAAVLALALAALLVRRWVMSLSIAGFGLLTFAVLAWSQSISFPADLVSAGLGSTRVISSGHALAGALGLIVVALAVQFASGLNRRFAQQLVATLLIVSSLPLAWLAVSNSSKVSIGSGSVVPLLLEKQAQQGTDLQLLVINQRGEEFQAQWTPLSGINLEDSNLAYRFSANQNKSEYLQLAQVVGDLASANGLANTNVLKANQIGYVLVPQTKANAGLVAALEASTALEGAGLTPFGNLWRVIGTSADDAPKTEHGTWSITKVLQLMALLGFALLALPSRTRVQRAKDSEIFIDQSESELDV